METVRAFFRTLRATLAYEPEAGDVENRGAAFQRDFDASQRMSRISDSFKALLLASPGR